MLKYTPLMGDINLYIPPNRQSRRSGKTILSYLWLMSKLYEEAIHEEIAQKEKNMKTKHTNKQLVSRIEEMFEDIRTRDEKIKALEARIETLMEYVNAQGLQDEIKELDTYISVLRNEINVTKESIKREEQGVIIADIYDEKFNKTKLKKAKSNLKKLEEKLKVKEDRIIYLNKIVHGNSYQWSWYPRIFDYFVKTEA